MTILANSKFRNKFIITLYVVESFMFCSYFSLAGILSFQKRYTWPKKIFGISKLFKKMWSQIPLFSANLDFEAHLYHENFKSKFQSCNLQLITFPKRYFASKWLRYHQKKVEKHKISPKNLIKNPLENHIFIEFSLLLNILLVISQPFVGRFWCKIAFWKRY